MNKKSTPAFAKFIAERARELQDRDIHEQREQEQKPVTVRLPSGYIALIDRFASELEMNRQSFLMQLIHEGLKDSIDAMTELAPEEKQREINMEYQTLMHGDLV